MSPSPERIPSKQLTGVPQQQQRHPPTQLIDNSQLAYIPVRLKCGMEARCRPEVLARCPLVLRDLDLDLHDCLQILPRSVHPLIRRAKIWVNVSYSVGYRDCPKRLNHATTHHDEAWLVWAKDRPEKTLSIEVYSCFDYQTMRLHWNGCGLMLHELCHLIHQQVLPGGLENVDVQRAYVAAEKSGLYEQVLRRDWAGKDVDCDMAYAMVDHREFFAEMSVAYWSRAYKELDFEVHSKMKKASPPIVSPVVKARVWKREGLSGDSLHQNLMKRLLPAGAWIGSKKLPHCNKFYPFTRGQLQRYDEETFRAIDNIWREIAAWDDPYLFGEQNCCVGCWKPRISKPPRPAVEVTCSDTIEF